MERPLRIVCLSDTHSRHANMAVPDGDVLVHAGDFTKRGTLPEVAAFDAWLASLPHRHKIVVAGNHDFLFERQPSLARATLRSALYLEHEAAEVAGLRVFGSPWQPWFHDWAFNLRRGEALRAKWAEVPADLDLLITHSPPYGVLDRVWDGERVGCEDLRTALARIRPRLHVFGHIHEAYGSIELDAFPGTRFVNAANCDLSYRVTQPAIVVDLEPRRAGAPGHS
jgi:Icc-related predicted phosphoesterase